MALERVNVSVSAADLKEIDRAAKSRGVSRSVFLVRSALAIIRDEKLTTDEEMATKKYVRDAIARAIDKALKLHGINRHGDVPSNDS